MRLKRPVGWFICFLSLLGASHHVYGEDQTPPAETQPEEFDEGLFEDATLETKQPPTPVDPVAPPPPAQRRITIQITTRLNYYLYPTKEQMELTYQFELSHQCNRPKELEQPLQCAFNGSAPVVTSVQGQLAKWSGGQCQLQVKVPNIPFGVVYAEQLDGSASVKFPTFGGPEIREQWEAQCSLVAEPDFALNTSGAPEEWINVALQKAKDALEQLSFTVSKFETEIPFTVVAEELDDEIARAVVVVEGRVVTALVEPGTTTTAEK